MSDLFEILVIHLRGSDLHNAVAPLLLGGQNHVLRHLGRVRHGRMVQVDAQLALRVKEVTKGVLDLHFGALWSGEEVVAHGYGSAARSDDLLIHKANSRPTFDGEALVLWSSIVSCDEVGQGTVELGSELHLRSQRRLEEDIPVLVSIECRDVVMSDLFEILAIHLRGSDL